jgi:hypothetical protein
LQEDNRQREVEPSSVFRQIGRGEVNEDLNARFEQLQLGESPRDAIHDFLDRSPCHARDFDRGLPGQRLPKDRHGTGLDLNRKTI